jgi:hypothetical protein
LIKLNNYNSSFCIRLGISESAVGSLKKYIHLIRTSQRIQFETNDNLFSEKSNWKKYREIIKKVSGPCVPYLGVILSDLKSLKESLVDGGMIHMEKCRAITSLLDDIRQLQVPYKGIEMISCVRKWMIELRDTLNHNSRHRNSIVTSHLKDQIEVTVTQFERFIQNFKIHLNYLPFSWFSVCFSFSLF